MSNTILIPGLLCDATVWQPLQALLQRPAFVADLTTQDDLTQMARDCLAMVDGPFKVVGHSMGARVAMEMARLAPQNMDRIALLDTGIHPLKDGEITKRREIVRFAYDHGMKALAERWLPGMVFAENHNDTQLMANLTEMVLRCDADLHARQIKALTNRPDASAYLDSITCPVLLMVGREDQWSPVSQHQDMLDLLPNAELEIIDKAGHFAPLEQPPSVAVKLSKFLE